MECAAAVAGIKMMELAKEEFEVVLVGGEWTAVSGALTCEPYSPGHYGCLLQESDMDL